MDQSLSCWILFNKIGSNSSVDFIGKIPALFACEDIFI